MGSRVTILLNMLDFCFNKAHVLSNTLDSFLDLLFSISIMSSHIFCELLKAVLNSFEKVFFGLVFILSLLVNLMKRLQVCLMLLLQSLLLQLLSLLSKLLVFQLHSFIRFPQISLDSFVMKLFLSYLRFYFF